MGRAVTGLAEGTWVPLVVLFSSLFPPEEAVRASSLLTLVGSVGRLLATSLTGSLNELGGYPLAFFGAAGAAILAILFKRRKPSPRLRPDLSSETDLAMVRLVRQREDSTIALYKEQLASVEGEVARIYRELMAVEEDHNLLLDELDGLVSG